MNKRRHPPEGFLLMEVLIAISVLAIAFVAFVAVLGQVLNITSRSTDLTHAIAKYETLFFDLENGERNDLVSYGGRGGIEGGYQYEILSQQETDGYFTLKTKIFWKGGKDFMDLDLLLPESPIQ